jgi:GTP-binding protein
VSFRREKFVPQGGPDGGDGGAGADVIVRADASVSTLGAYRDRRSFHAPDGQPGAAALKTGRRGEDLVLAVPPGTVVSDAATGEVLADLDAPGASVVAAAGGRGGRGNARFASSTRQAPRIGELGAPGERRRIHLELKLIADIGLVGLPNAGKSTLLAALTGARPKIADYPFTTLQPNLGVAEVEGGRTVIIADVPGLIEGASHGAGLGLDFLRHLDRTRVLVHVVDASLGGDGVQRATEQVTGELRAFSATLAAKPSLLALNKVDLAEAAATARSLAAAGRAWPIAAATGEGTRELLDAAAALVFAARAGEAAHRAAAAGAGQHGEPERVYRQRRRGGGLGEFTVVREDAAYRVLGEAVERVVAMTDLDSEEAVARLQRRLRQAGVDDALRRAGCGEGDTVRIGEAEFDWSDADAV